MKKVMSLMVFGLFIMGCHRDSHIAEGTGAAGTFSGTFNGQPSSMTLYKRGDQVTGKVQVGGTSYDVSGYQDPNRMTIGNIDGKMVTMTFTSNNKKWTVVDNGSGEFNFVSVP